MEGSFGQFQPKICPVALICFYLISWILLAELDTPIIIFRALGLLFQSKMMYKLHICKMCLYIHNDLLSYFIIVDHFSPLLSNSLLSSSSTLSLGHLQSPILSICPYYSNILCFVFCTLFHLHPLFLCVILHLIPHS